MEAARLAPTHVNRQPLQFAAISSWEMCQAIFPHTFWAKRIADGSAGPDETSQPRAYIAVFIDRRIVQQSDIDAGAAGMSILLAAESLGVATCWLGNIHRADILALLGLDPERYALHSIIALGYPAMQARAVPLTGDATDYYLESANSLCVPKRAAEDVCHWYE